MNMPGFTAEASFHIGNGHYRMSRHNAIATDQGGVSPQAKIKIGEYTDTRCYPCSFEGVFEFILGAGTAWCYDRTCEVFLIDTFPYISQTCTDSPLYKAKCDRRQVYVD